jgi:signal transduction histidine kinase
VWAGRMTLAVVAPVTGPADDGGMSKDDGTATGPDAWSRMLVGWHVAFWLMVGVATVYILVTTDLDAGGRWRAGGLLATLAVGYLVTVMRGPEACRTWAGSAYVLLAIAVVGLASAVDPGLTMLLFIVYPQVWMFTPTLRRGLAACIALTVVATAGIGSSLGWSDAVLRDVVPQMIVTAVFSVLLGFWITKVIEQSTQRRLLIAELKQTRGELAAAHHDQGVAAERERMAREIHDTLAQGFTSIVMLAQAGLAASSKGDRSSKDAAAQRLTAIEAVARENLAEARALVAAFSPVDLDGATLADAVTRLGQRFAERSGVPVDVQISGSLAGLARDQEVVLLRAVQEALANVRRHAEARTVTVRLLGEEGGARVEVRDDGVGFAPDQVEGYGLSGMRARAVDVGGQVAVDSQAGRGTRVEVRVPVAPAAPTAAVVPREAL